MSTVLASFDIHRINIFKIDFRGKCNGSDNLLNK